MRNWKQRLERLEQVAAPEVTGMAVIFSRTNDQMRASARGKEVHRLPNETENDFLDRAVSILGPIGGIIMVPEKGVAGASLQKKVT